jgi:hypothetical protein
MSRSKVTDKPMRKAHFMRDNKALDFPQQAIWFDTETKFELVDKDTTYHHLKFGYACYMRQHRDGIWTDEEWFRFTTRTEFWDWVYKHVRDSTKLYMFCHNTSFDLPVLDVFKEMSHRGFKLRTAIIDAPPTILRFRSSVDSQQNSWFEKTAESKVGDRNHTRCIMILDTLNIWRMPLKYLGEEIGLEKLTMPEDNDMGVDWETYGKRDVEIIRNACIKWWHFLQENDYGSFAPTLAGQAMRVFRHKYMVHQIWIDDNREATALSRGGYHGARCECFRIGKFKGNFTLLDVNSMYPSVMADHQFPHKLITYTTHGDVLDLENWCREYCVMSRVILRTNVPFAPVKSKGKLIFPVGEFECILSTAELVEAFKFGEVLHVIETAIYQKAYLFTTMMHDLYARRIASKKNGNLVAAFMYRKIMNSFYGKWGQTGGKWIDVENTDNLITKRRIEYDAVTDTMTYHRWFGGLHQKRDTEAESGESFPAIAAHVTAYARVKLFNIIRLAGEKNVYYCDTDSVLVNDEGLKNLEFLLDKELMGKLSIKGKYESIEIWGAKDYRFGDISKTKGVRKEAIWLDEHNVEQTKWSGLRGLIASGTVDKPITKTIRKHLERLYDKGTVLADGTVLPLFRQVSDCQDD